MAQKQSWNGNLTAWYEKNLGLKGGYSRKRRKGKSSIENSEYVKSDNFNLWLYAVGGRKVTPRIISQHYNHPYGNEMLARQRNEDIKRKQKSLKEMRRMVK